MGLWCGLSGEVGSPVTKTAKPGHRSIAQIFRDAAVEGREEDIDLCHEIERELNGAQLVTCSKYVKALRDKADRLIKEEKESSLGQEGRKEGEERVLVVPTWIYQTCWCEGWTWRVLGISERRSAGLECLREGFVRLFEQAVECEEKLFGVFEQRMVPQGKEATRQVEELLLQAEEEDRRREEEQRSWWREAAIRALLEEVQERGSPLLHE